MKTAKDISKQRHKSIIKKIRKAKEMGLNTNNIFMNKTDVDALEEKLDKFLEKKEIIEDVEYSE